ncbi:MAG TPA: TetR/AcrR family transcriptional regulator [Jatrophihabitantaceae bacterium]|jgi:AcrR family transcriptional regulator|nr:TetR/AcrR family transcriptional regulator [Jatrophihabitantaceae bacterium]
MSAPAEPRRRRLEPDQRRREILACARRLFGERPYADVSTTEVADAAGVARGLINHYFGTKRDLYLEVVRELLTVPAFAVAALPDAALEVRVDAAVDWLLDVLSRHGNTWLAATGASAVGNDPELEQIMRQADDESADRVLEVVGMGDTTHREQFRAMIRAYAALVRGAGREWLVTHALSREQVHLLLTRTLLAIVRDAFPAATTDAGRAPNS